MQALRTEGPSTQLPHPLFSISDVLALAWGQSQAKAKPKWGQAKPSQIVGLSWLLAWPDISESQSPWPGPGLKRPLGALLGAHMSAALDIVFDDPSKVCCSILFPIMYYFCYWSASCPASCPPSQQIQTSHFLPPPLKSWVSDSPSGKTPPAN